MNTHTYTHNVIFLFIDVLLLFYYFYFILFLYYNKINNYKFYKKKIYIEAKAISYYNEKKYNIDMRASEFTMSVYNYNK